MTLIERLRKLSRQLDRSDQKETVSDAIDRLQAELAECKRDSDALRQDSERLVWICDHFFESQWNGVIDSGSKTHWRIAGNYRHTAAKMEGFYFRDAIDAAIAAMGEKK